MKKTDAYNQQKYGIPGNYTMLMSVFNYII